MKPTILTPEMASTAIEVHGGTVDALMAVRDICLGRTVVVDAELNREAWALIEQHAKAWLRTAECRALIAKRKELEK